RNAAIEFTMLINFVTSRCLKCIYFIRYELLKFNNRFIRIATFRRNVAMEFMLPLNINNS
ncbi:MAG: hypothetical protein LBP59_01880, partial [Planctomycetaceae bacterium]|nr:hypothetical protein [Planctomycetaceae bacterium]